MHEDPRKQNNTRQQLTQLLADTAGMLRSQQAYLASQLEHVEPVAFAADPLFPSSCFSQPWPQATSKAAISSEGKPADAKAALAILEQQTLGDCRRCKLSQTRHSIVFGSGNANAQLMFVGEGPGRDEDLQGEPFVGEAGKLLTRMIVAMGLKREHTYIANIVKCRPPRNRNPEPDEVAACEPFLQQQIRLVNPQVIVALGRYAAQTLLRDTTPISQLRGHFRTYEGIALMPTFHPAYLLRNPTDKRLVWQDLQQVMQILKK